MSKGKSKGSQWEREIAKYLTRWLTGQSNEYYFWRSPGSGSIGTISCTNPDLHGDIIPLKEEASVLCSEFIIECKNGYPSANLNNILKYNKKDELRDFWVQVTTGAVKTNKSPILIFKKKGFKDPWIGIDTSTYSKYIGNLKKIRYIFINWEKDLRNLLFFNMEEFFSNITSKIIKEINNEKNINK